MYLCVCYSYFFPFFLDTDATILSSSKFKFDENYAPELIMIVPGAMNPTFAGKSW